MRSHTASAWAIILIGVSPNVWPPVRQSPRILSRVTQMDRRMYRRDSRHDMCNLGQLIGRGYHTEVFAYSDERVIKLFFDPDAWENAVFEAGATNDARDSGLAAPRVFDVVRVHGRPGIVMDRIDGATMLEWATALPWRIHSAGKLTARLHAQIHSKTRSSLPRLNELQVKNIEKAAGVDDDLKQLALSRLARLPEGESVCHGDFHPDNIIMSKSVPVVIDWQNCAKSHPSADVARTVVLVQSGVPLVGRLRRAVVEAGRRYYLSTYLNEYFTITGMRWEEVSPWLLPTAIATIHDVFPENAPSRSAYIQRLISQL